LTFPYKKAFKCFLIQLTILEVKFIDH
jgi:hypothetical protein